MEATVWGLHLEGDEGKIEYQLSVWLFFSLSVIVVIISYLAHH